MKVSYTKTKKKTTFKLKFNLIEKLLKMWIL